MHRFLHRCRIATLWLLSATALNGQTAPSPVATRSPISLRSAGMNGAAAAMVGDAGSVFTNPAGLATIRHIALEGGYRTTPLDGRMVSGALGIRLRQFDLGVGLHLLDRGFDLGRALDSIGGDPPQTDPGFASYEALGVASLVYRWGIIAVGGSVKGARQELEFISRRGLGVDAGLTIAIFDILAIGFSTQNIGGNLNGGAGLSMPGMSRLGFMMNYVDPLESFRLLSTVEIQWPEGRSTRLVLGTEGGIIVSGVGVRARAGYATAGYGEGSSDFTFGASVELGTSNIDWAYDPEGLLGEPVHRLGIRLRL